MVVPGPSASGNFLKKRDLARLGLLATLAAGGYLAVQFTPLGAYFSRSFLVSFFDAIRMRWWSPLAFISLYAIACAFAAPAALWTFVGGAVFGVFPGFLYNLIASNLGATLSFFVARMISPSSLAGLLRKTPLVSRRLDKGTIGGVFMLRFLLIFPFNVVNVLAGVSRIRYRHYLIGSFAGMLPATIAYTVLGDGIMTHLRMPSAANLARLAALGLLLAGVGLYTWVFIRTSEKAKPS